MRGGIRGRDSRLEGWRSMRTVGFGLRNSIETPNSMISLLLCDKQTRVATRERRYAQRGIRHLAGSIVVAQAVRPCSTICSGLTLRTRQKLGARCSSLSVW